MMAAMVTLDKSSTVLKNNFSSRIAKDFSDRSRLNLHLAGDNSPGPSHKLYARSFQSQIQYSRHVMYTKIPLGLVNARRRHHASCLSTFEGEDVSITAEFPESSSSREIPDDELLSEDAEDKSDKAETSRKTLAGISDSQSTSSKNLANQEQARRPTKSMEEDISPIRKQKRKKMSLPKVPEEFRLLSNAELAARGPGQQVGRSLGIDFGDRRTGVAVSYKGFAPRALTVVVRQGRELVNEILDIAKKEMADEIILGMPRSWNYLATEQTQKTLRFASLLTRYASRSGYRVFLYDEFNTSKNAMAHMLNTGSNKRTRQHKLDAYAALNLLELYFEFNGKGSVLVLPDEQHLREHLREVSPKPGKIMYDEFDDDF